jgi:hypothetical protein
VEGTLAVAREEDTILHRGLASGVADVILDEPA